MTPYILFPNPAEAAHVANTVMINARWLTSYPMIIVAKNKHAVNVTRFLLHRNQLYHMPLVLDILIWHSL